MSGERVERLLLRGDVPGLERALASPDAATREAAARALAAMATTSPPRPLISAGDDDEADQALRLRAAHALARHEPALAVQLFSEALNGPDSSRAVFAVEALAATGTAEATDAIARTLASHGDWRVRRAAALALEAAGGAAAERALRAYHAAPRSVVATEGAGDLVRKLARYLSEPGADADTRRGALLQLEGLGTFAAMEVVRQYHGGAPDGPGTASPEGEGRR